MNCNLNKVWRQVVDNYDWKHELQRIISDDVQYEGTSYNEHFQNFKKNFLTDNEENLRELESQVVMEYSRLYGSPKHEILTKQAITNESLTRFKDFINNTMAVEYIYDEEYEKCVLMNSVTGESYTIERSEDWKRTGVSTPFGEVNYHLGFHTDDIKPLAILVENLMKEFSLVVYRFKRDNAS